MKRTILLLVILLLTACTAVPSTPALTPTPTFASSRYGTSEIDVTYCTMEDLPQKMDIYFPSSGGPWPVVMYVHGGSWVEGDKAEGVGWSYLNSSGFLVVSVNYRLGAYNIKFPAMIQDVKCAVRYLRAHAFEYNIDTNRIAALGVSAGGHLVALMGTADESAGWDVGEYLDQSSRVQAVVDIAGPADFTRKISEALNTSVYFVFGALSGKNSPLMVAASPVTYVTSDDPPFLIIHGEKDGVVAVEQAEILNTRLTEAGIKSTLVIVQNGEHNLQNVQGKPTTPTQAEISDLILEFLESNLK